MMTTKEAAMPDEGQPTTRELVKGMLVVAALVGLAILIPVAILLATTCNCLTPA